MLTSSRIFLFQVCRNNQSKNTCGPVLNVHVWKLCGVHSIEVQIESLSSQGHISWILICRGLDDNKVYTPGTSLLKPKDDPEPVVLTPRINSTGKPVPGTQDSRKDKRDNIPDGTWVISAYGDESGSDVHSSRRNDCTRETGTRFLSQKEIPVQERKWIMIPSILSYDLESLPSRISKMVTRMVRHCDQDERGLDGAAHWNTICPLLEKAFE